MSTIWSSFLLLLPLFVGCVKLQLLPYMDQALTLQEFGREKDEQNKYIKNADAKFDELWAAVASGDIKKYKSEQEIVAAFGPPIFIKSAPSGGKKVRQALYRYCIQSKGPHRVYLYYDENALLSRFETI